jgi:acyl carrier protein
LTDAGCHGPAPPSPAGAPLDSGSALILTTPNSTVPDILARLQPVFREVLEKPTLLVTREDSAMTIDGWDSFAHVVLISSVEREFGVRFALGELEELKCVGDMVDLIAKKISA